MDALNRSARTGHQHPHATSDAITRGGIGYGSSDRLQDGVFHIAVHKTM